MRQAREGLQSICFHKIIEEFGREIWRYLTNLFLKAQLISKLDHVAQALVLSRMDVISKDGDIFSSSAAQTSWPVWPRLLKPFVPWPGSGPRVACVPLARSGCLLSVTRHGSGGAGVTVRMAPGSTLDGSMWLSL